MSFGLNSVSAMAVLDLRQVLIQLGVIKTEDLPALGLTDSNLLKQALNQTPIQEQRTEEKHLLHLWQLAEQHTALPHIGLLIGEHYHSESRGLLANWLFQCDTLQQSLEVFIKHIPLMNPSERWKFTVIDSQRTRLFIEFSEDKKYPRAAIERSMRSLLVWGLELTGEPLPALEVTFSGAKPTYHDKLVDILGSNIKYNHENNSILIPSRYLAKKVLSRNPYLNDIMQEKASHALEALQQDLDLVTKIKHIVRNNLANMPDIEAVSRQLNLSRATLYRQLKNRGTTYSDIVTDIQKNTAREWLRKGKATSAISIDLGFADTSAFYKAFKRWYGVTPTEFKYHDLN